MIRSMDGLIRHRLLLNYAADPELVARLLPPPLRPQLVRGYAVVGVCVLRLAQLRPAGLPGWMGVTSDNAAHRIAVEWDGPEGTDVGVYVLRRDSAQRLPVMVGGRLFPGVHGPARFSVDDHPDGLHVEYQTVDGLEVDVSTGPPAEWSSRLFADAAEASAFFEGGATGYSRGQRGCLEGIEMHTDRWSAQPVSATAWSSFFDDGAMFPSASIHPDAALLMRDLPVTWRDVPVPRRAGARAVSRGGG